MEKTLEAGPFKPEDVQHLKLEVEYRTRIHEICNKIHAARDLDEILRKLEPEITTLFQAERLTLYTIDGITDELVSRFKSGDEIKEIRLPVSTDSIAGHSAFNHRPINVGNVYDKEELKAIHPRLRFDRSWDARTGYLTKQVLAYPISFNKYLLGAFQLINRRDNTRFSIADEQAAHHLAETFGIAIYNHKRRTRSKAHRYQYLIDQELITEGELHSALSTTKRKNGALDEILMNDFGILKEDIGRSLSQFYKVPFVKFHLEMEKPRSLIKGLKIPFLKKNNWVPLRMEQGRIVIAMADPANLQVIDEIKAVLPGRPLMFCVSTGQDIHQMIDLFEGHLKEPDPIDDILSQLPVHLVERESSESHYSEHDSMVVQLVNKIIIDALEEGASDVHIEPYPGKQETQIRFRVDGACRLYREVPASFRKALVSRIKVMASLDIAEKRRPQDGKILFNRMGKEKVELRVATIPTQGKIEDVVVRIFSNNKPKPLSEIHFSKRNLNNFMEAVTRPHGIILVCGPTGSGKTTTLHAALHHINDVTKKIWTAEDPVELTQAGLRQVQVHRKIDLDFSTAMRAFLRADPDVIMVGEMRDRETARIGIEASLTGHLVLSTLHTNSAPESIVRLLDMGMDPFNFSDAVICILAQRLIPMLCGECKEPFIPTDEEINSLAREYEPASLKQYIGVVGSHKTVIYRPVGCEKCRHTGYAGRMALHELLMGTAPIKRLIQTGAPVEKLREQAILDGMTTLMQDGIEKVIAGHCDIRQVRKVCIK